MVARKPRGSPVGMTDVTAATAEGLMSTTWAGRIGVSRFSHAATSASARDGG